MNLQELKDEMQRLSQQSTFSQEDIMSVTRMATMILESDKLSDAHKKKFAEHMTAVKQRGVQNLQPGDVKMIANLFVQGLS